MPISSDSPVSPPGDVWSVGEVAASLSLPTSTVRTWERRYGLAPSVRTPGGHRRYDAADLDRMRLMRQLVDQGVAPSEAARTVLRAGRADAPILARTLGGPAPWADEVVAASRRLDANRLRALFQELFEAQGVCTAWDPYVTPLLRRMGEEWASGDLGIESEHLVSEVLLTTLRSRSNRLTTGTQPPVVIMASAEDDQHSLAVVALQAALAENHVEAHVFGQRLPAAALATLVARFQPKAVFLWASMPRPNGDRLHRVVTALSTSTRIVLGGPGWESTSIPQARHARDLSTALAALVAEV
ncbi:MAG: MerR family transcriptional regulator, partial [Actinomycetales bacterium]